MKFVKIRTVAAADELFEMLKDNDATNMNVKFEHKRGTPYIHTNGDCNKLSLKCEFVGGSTKDNAFIEGTAFHGKIKERGGYTEISGIILTAPIFHIILFAMFAVFIAFCIINGGFNITPVCLIVFDLFMYKDEFAKQGIIERYIRRAVRRTEASQNQARSNEA